MTVVPKLSWFHLAVLFQSMVLSAAQTDSLATQNNSKSTQAPNNRTLFVIVFDGLRPEILRETHAQGRLQSLKATYPEHLFPVVPPLTLPATVSLVTGLGPSRHGFIDNFLYDSDSQTSFVYSQSESIDFSLKWWANFTPVWDHLHSVGGKKVSVYGTNLCGGQTGVNCYPQFVLDSDSLSKVFSDSVDSQQNVVFIFDHFIQQQPFETISEFNQVVTESSGRVLTFCEQLQSLAENISDFNVIVAGNRAQMANNFYFIDIVGDVIAKSQLVSTSDISFIPPSIDAQYFSLYSPLNASVLQSELSDTSTQINVLPLEQVDKKRGSKLAQAEFAPKVVLTTEKDFAISTSAKSSIFTMLDGFQKRHVASAETAVFAFGPEFIDEPIDESASILDVALLICDVMQIPSITSHLEDQSDSSLYSLARMLKRNPHNGEPFHPLAVIILIGVIVGIALSMVVFLIVRKHRLESGYSLPEKNPPQLEMQEASSASAA